MFYIGWIKNSSFHGNGLYSTLDGSKIKEGWSCCEMFSSNYGKLEVTEYPYVNAKLYLSNH